VAVADFGAGFEATVLRRGPSGFEVLATVDAADGGGDRLDHAFAEHLTALVQAADQAAGTGPDPPPAAAPNPWPLRESARIAKESLAYASEALDADGGVREGSAAPKTPACAGYRREFAINAAGAPPPRSPPTSSPGCKSSPSTAT
jgi:hypothetical protein